MKSALHAEDWDGSHFPHHQLPCMTYDRGLREVRDFFIWEVYFLIQTVCQTSKTTPTNYRNFWAKRCSCLNVVCTLGEVFIGVSAKK